jgi:two-component system, OmpR family, phosphate regulon sensor histidine kinase PhoR
MDLSEGIRLYRAYGTQQLINERPVAVPPDMSRMDSLFHSFLSEAGLNVRSGVRILRPAADQVISQTGDASIQRGSFVTTPLHLTEDGSECVQGVVPGSVMTVIHSVWYLFLPLFMEFVRTY